MKKLSKLKGVIPLGKIQQKSIYGGGNCTTDRDCTGPPYVGGCFYCLSGWCFDPNPTGEPCEEF